MGGDTDAVELMVDCVRLRKTELDLNHPYTISSSFTLTVWLDELFTAFKEYFDTVFHKRKASGN